MNPFVRSLCFISFFLFLLSSAVVRAQTTGNDTPKAPVVVAVAFDGTWVNEDSASTVLTYLSPSSTADATLVPIPLNTNDPAQWAQTLSSTNVLVVAAPGQGSSGDGVAYLNSAGSSPTLADVIRNWTAAGGLFVQAGHDAQVVSYLFGLSYLPASAASLLPANPTASSASTPYAALGALDALNTSWELEGVPLEDCLYSTADSDDLTTCSVVRQNYGAGRLIYLAWDFSNAAAQNGQAWESVLQTAAFSDVPSQTSPSPSASPSPSPSLPASTSPSPSTQAIATNGTNPSPSVSVSPSYSPSASPNGTQASLSPTPSPALSPTFYPSPSPSPSSVSPSPSPSVGSSHSPSPSPSHSHHDDDDDEDPPPPFEMDLVWVVCAVVLTVVVLAIVAGGVKLIERFGRRREYTEIPAGNYDEEEEYYHHQRV